MPIYEYTCDTCGEITEALQKVSDPPLEKCEKCGGRLTKLISNSTFILKGTGWYVTDYGGKKNGGGGKDKFNAKGDNGNDGAAKSDTAKEIKAEKMPEKPKESDSKKGEKGAGAS
jgi:putative FmdB family regulatory protein